VRGGPAVPAGAGGVRAGQRGPVLGTLAARQEEASRLRKQAEGEDKQTRKLEQKMKVQLHGYQVSCLSR